MSILKHPIFIAIVTVATGVYLLELFEIKLPWIISNYLNDLLCMPLVLSLSLVIIRILKKDDKLYVPLVVVVIVTLYYAFHFEWLIPKFNARYTADAIDVALYSFGAFLFYRFQKQLF